MPEYDTIPIKASGSRKKPPEFIVIPFEFVHFLTYDQWNELLGMLIGPPRLALSKLLHPADFDENGYGRAWKKRWPKSNQGGKVSNQGERP